MNQIVNNQTQGIYLLIDNMKGAFDEENEKFYTKLFQNNQTVKTHYLALKFNEIENEFYPQINNISMKMPSAPVLFDWDSVIQVYLLFTHLTFIHSTILLSILKCKEFGLQRI